MKISIIGTGIIGVCCAAWLQRYGHEIIFYDAEPPGSRCSFGNAGSLSPGACLPVGMPGMWKRVPKWLLDPLGPLAIRPEYFIKALPWITKLLRHSSTVEVERIASSLRTLLKPIFENYEPILENANATDLIKHNGCLYVYSTQQKYEQWRWGMDLRRALGVSLRDVSETELEEIEPALMGQFRFGQLAAENASAIDPSKIVKSLYDQCIADGALSVRQNIESVVLSRRKVTHLITDTGENHSVEGMVICAGAWSKRLAKLLGNKIPLETQRGYHATVHSTNITLNHTVMVVERNTMVNPMAMGLRLAGSVEFAGLNASPNWARAHSLLKIGTELFPNLDISDSTFWMGHRPCLPDSLPVIGATKNAENSWYAFGHGHMGMCMAATTGKGVAELISGIDSNLDLTPFRADRF